MMYEVRVGRELRDKLFRVWEEEEMQRLGYRPWVDAYVHMKVFPVWLKERYGILANIIVTTEYAATIWTFPSEEEYSLFMLKWA